MEQSLFTQTLELLKVVNELEKRGHRFEEKLIQSLVVTTVGNYNQEHAPRPVAKEQKPEQVQPVEDRKER